MAGGGRRTVLPKAFVGLHRRLDTLHGRHPDRARMVEQATSPYGVSATPLYRQLRTLHRWRPVRRADRGQPRKLPAADLERWCEIIAALKLRTTNKKGRHLADEMRRPPAARRARRRGPVRVGAGDRPALRSVGHHHRRATPRRPAADLLVVLDLDRLVRLAVELIRLMDDRERSVPSIYRELGGVPASTLDHDRHADGTLKAPGVRLLGTAPAGGLQRNGMAAQGA